MSLIVLLFALGLFLLALEVMLPGGILGIAAGILLFTGCVLSFTELGTSQGLVAVLVALTSAIIVFYIQFKILPKTPAGKRFFLRRQISSSSSQLREKTQDLIGKTAKSVTVLSPTGIVAVDGEQFEAVSQSGQVAKDTELEIISTNSFQLTVRTKQ